MAWNNTYFRLVGPHATLVAAATNAANVAKYIAAGWEPITRKAAQQILLANGADAFQIAQVNGGFRGNKIAIARAFRSSALYQQAVDRQAARPYAELQAILAELIEWDRATGPHDHPVWTKARKLYERTS